MLKFEGKFKVGDVIKSYDFMPSPDRPDRYVEGEVLDGSFRHETWGFLGYKIRVTKCVPDDYRVGEEIIVPFQVSIGDFDDRITLSKGGE